MLKQKLLQMNNTPRLSESSRRSGSEAAKRRDHGAGGGLYSGSGSSEDFQVVSKEPNHWRAWISKNRPSLKGPITELGSRSDQANLVIDLGATHGSGSQQTHLMHGFKKTEAGRGLGWHDEKNISPSQHYLQSHAHLSFFPWTLPLSGFACPDTPHATHPRNFPAFSGIPRPCSN